MGHGKDKNKEHGVGRVVKCDQSEPTLRRFRQVSLTYLVVNLAHSATWAHGRCTYLCALLKCTTRAEAPACFLEPDTQTGLIVLLAWNHAMPIEFASSTWKLLRAQRNYRHSSKGTLELSRACFWRVAALLIDMQRSVEHLFSSCLSAFCDCAPGARALRSSRLTLLLLDRGSSFVPVSASSSRYLIAGMQRVQQPSGPYSF